MNTTFLYCTCAPHAARVNRAQQGGRRGSSAGPSQEGAGHAAATLVHGGGSKQPSGLAFSTLKPIVGTVLSTSPMCSLYRMVVLPAASSPACRQERPGALATAADADAACAMKARGAPQRRLALQQPQHAPSITTRISLLPNNPSNSFLKVFPILARLQAAKAAVSRRLVAPPPNRRSGGRPAPCPRRQALPALRPAVLQRRRATRRWQLLQVGLAARRSRALLTRHASTLCLRPPINFQRPPPASEPSSLATALCRLTSCWMH